MIPLTADELKALEEKARASTQGVWNWREGIVADFECEMRYLNGDDDTILEPKDVYTGYPECGEELRILVSPQNAAHIAAASPKTILRLLHTIRVQQRALETMSMDQLANDEDNDATAQQNMRAYIEQAARDLEGM
jgi:hypothetical protein